jgi:hypothetical protein
MDDFEEGGKSAKQKRKEKEARRRASRSALIKVRRMTTFPPTNIPRLVFGLGFFLPLNFLGLRRAFVGTPLHGDRRRPFLVAHSARTKSWAGYRPPRRGRLSNQELDSLSFLFFSFPELGALDVSTFLPAARAHRTATP